MEDKLIGTNTLQAYLDTGYTPEQVRDMAFLYREKCREVARLRSELQVLKERDTEKRIKLVYGLPTCPECGERVLKCYTFCKGCGQRLKQ